LLKGSSFSGVTGLRVSLGKSSKLGDKISGLFLGENPVTDEELQLFAKLGNKVLIMRLFLKLLFLLS